MSDTNGGGLRRPARSFKHSKMGAPPSQEQQATPRNVVAPAVLGDVLEHSPVGAPFVRSSTVLSVASGFPDVQRRTRGHLPLGRRGGPPTRLAGGSLSSEPRAADALRGDRGALDDGIDEENRARIATMSASEICEAQRELRDSLPPARLRALRNRGQQQHQQRHRWREEEGGGCGEEENATQQADRATTVAASDTVAQGLESGTKTSFDDSSRRDLEEAKLKWTAPLDNDRPPELSTYEEQWRFGFDGLEVSQDLDRHDLSATELYHHGNDPASPGYTIPEIFMLARSTVPSQRVVGLQLLGAVVRQACVSYFSRHSSPRAAHIINTVLDPKLRLMLLLRCALDDTHVNIHRAAVTVIRVLMVNQSDFAARDLLARQSEQWRSFATDSVRSDPTRTDEIWPSNADQLTIGEQEQLCHRDLIAGFVQMGILSRFRYILEVLMPPQPCALDIISVLRRCCHHSGKVARKILECPRLIEWLVAECTRRCVQSLNSESWLIECLRLLHDMCSASAHVANEVWKVGVQPMISNILVDADIDNTRCIGVVCEVLRLWGVLLNSSGPLHDSVASAFNTLLLDPKVLDYLEPRQCVDAKSEIAANFLATLEMLLRGSISKRVRSVHWETVAPIFHRVVLWLQKLQPEFDKEILSVPVASLVGSLFHFMASYICALSREYGNSDSICNDRLASLSAQGLLDQCLVPCFSSTAMQSTIVAAAGSHWFACVCSSASDNGTQLDTCCPRLGHEPSSDTEHLHAGVGALRCLHFCVTFQSSQWVPSAALVAVVKTFCSMLPMVQSSWPDQSSDGAEPEFIHCRRMASLFRVLFCRVIFAASPTFHPNTTQLNNVIDLAMTVLHGFGPGDEAVFYEFVSDIALQEQGLRALMTTAVANDCCPALERIDPIEIRTHLLQLAQAGRDPVNLRHMLPLRSPLFMLPSEFNDRSHKTTFTVIEATRSGLQLLLLLTSARCNYGPALEPSCGRLSLADTWCFLCRALMFSESVWQDESCGALVDGVMDQLMHAETNAAVQLNLHEATVTGLGKFGSIAELLEQLLRIYGEESFGDARLGRCVSLFVRVDQNCDIRQQVWRCCVDSGGALLERLRLTAAPLGGYLTVADAGDYASQESQLVRLQMRALLTPAAAAIASSHRKTDLYCAAVESVGLHMCTREGTENEDEGDAWERRQLLAQFSESATPEVFNDVCGKRRWDWTQRKLPSSGSM